MSDNFTPELELQREAQRLANEAVTFLAKHFRMNLDYSDKSVEVIEILLDRFHHDLAASKPSPDQIEYYSQMFGSYVGETFRRNHGAVWGSTPNNGQKNACMCLNGGFFSPWDRAYKRITIGDTERIDVYYHYILEKAKENPVPPPLPPPLPSQPNAHLCPHCGLPKYHAIGCPNRGK